jgi:hypothetical protein
MFNDRDLILMGAGALLAIFCLFLPMPFIVKAFLGGILLVGAMVLALLRLGPDRVPFEVWLQRRWRFGRKPKRYTYHHPKPEPEPQVISNPKPDNLVHEEEPASLPTEEIQASPLVSVRPVELAWGEIGTYNLIRVWLMVVGIYVVYWIFQGGAEEIAFMLKTLGF